MPPPLRALIIHGYQGYPTEAWMPWLQSELTRRGFAVAVPALPQPDRPSIDAWTERVLELIGTPDENLAIVAHSLGTFAVLRALERLADRGQRIGRLVIVAGRFPPGLPAAQAAAAAGGDPALAPWFELQVDPQRVRQAAGRCTVILSDNDPYVAFAEAQASYAPWPEARIVIEPGQGHFNEDDHLTELPSALAAVIAGL